MESQSCLDDPDASKSNDVDEGQHQPQLDKRGGSVVTSLEEKELNEMLANLGAYNTSILAITLRTVVHIVLGDIWNCSGRVFTHS